MRKAEKQQRVKELADVISKAKAIYFTDFTDLDANLAVELRKKFKSSSLDYKVVKNSLARLAAEEAGVTLVRDLIEGPTAIAYSFEDPLVPAKLLKDFWQENKLPRIKSGFVEGRVFTPEQVEKYADLGSREEVLSKVLTTVKSPIAHAVVYLRGILWRFLGTLKVLQTAQNTEVNQMAEKKENKVSSIVEEIGQLTVLELAELVKTLEDKFGVQAAVPAAPQQAPAEAQKEAAEEEKTEFDAVLSEVGNKKIQVIKVVRALTGLGLKEAKSLVDSAPKSVKEKVSRDEAEEVKGKLEEVGAKVEIK